jgi:tRNA 2-thiouridine synthesizing protein A
MAHDTSASPPVDDTIDVRGLQCPLPVLKARKRLKAMKEKDILKVIATDPAAIIDFPYFCSEAGHELISAAQEGGELIFIIRNSHG